MRCLSYLILSGRSFSWQVLAPPLLRCRSEACVGAAAARGTPECNAQQDNLQRSVKRKTHCLFQRATRDTMQRERLHSCTSQRCNDATSSVPRAVGGLEALKPLRCGYACCTRQPLWRVAAATPRATRCAAAARRRPERARAVGVHAAALCRVAWVERQGMAPPWGTTKRKAGGWVLL